MLFSFCLFNHSGAGLQSVSDLTSLIAAQLQDLGHRVGRSDHAMVPGAVNLVFENFFPDAIDALKPAAGHGVRFVIIATERPGPDGFYSTTYPEWAAARTEAYGQAAAMALSVWCLQPDAMDWYRGQSEQVDLAELGYSPRLINRLPVDPPGDFCFFGSMPQHRQEIVADLAHHATVFIPPPAERGLCYLPDAIRNDMVWKSKVVLHLKQKADWPIISACRCATALHLGRPVFSEPVDCDSPWNDVVRFASSRETFPEEALWVRDNWRGEYLRQAAAFRKLDAERCLGAAVCHTIELLEDSYA